MASDETMTFQSSLQDEEEFDDDIDDGLFDHHDQHQHHHHHLNHQTHPHNLSRLSVCTSSTLCGVDDDDEDDDVDNAMSTYVSQLSIESFDADGEFSDSNKELQQQQGGLTMSSDSENDVGSCYSLPLTSPRRRNNHVIGYASDNEAQNQKGVLKLKTKNNDPSRRRSRRTTRRGVNSNNNNLENLEKSENSNKSKKKEEEENQGVQGFSGESDQSVGGGSNGTGVMVITRPKGGRRSLCMDLEEVKACRDLGFELEHERMLDMMPSHLSVSNSTLDTSSGGNSPIANWRISSPGDDPRDVKARLKVWAQAVALASTSKYGT